MIDESKRKFIAGAATLPAVGLVSTAEADDDVAIDMEKENKWYDPLPGLGPNVVNVPFAEMPKELLEYIHNAVVEAGHTYEYQLGLINHNSKTRTTITLSNEDDTIRTSYYTRHNYYPGGHVVIRNIFADTWTVG